MTLFRWLLGMPMAALITAGLFFMMAQLIRDKGVELIPPKPNLDLKITAEPPPENPYDHKPKRPDDLKPPPETPIDIPKSGRAPMGLPAAPPYKPAPTTPPGKNGQFSGAVIKVTPPYPEGCRSKGAEGIVVVQYDVTPEGNVTNARVIETPNACFVRPILKAVSGWKYPPVASGSAMRYGLVETFNFQLVE
jgi:protein TonB